MLHRKKTNHLCCFQSPPIECKLHTNPIQINTQTVKPSDKNQVAKNQNSQIALNLIKQSPIIAAIKNTITNAQHRRQKFLFAAAGAFNKISTRRML